MYYFTVYNILWRMSTEKHKKERKSVDFPHIPDRLSVPIDYMAALFLVKLGEPCGTGGNAPGTKGPPKRGCHLLFGGDSAKL